MGVDFHFLNVGSGDCTIIHFPSRTRRSDQKKKSERIMVVDVYTYEESEDYEDVIEYYKNNFANEDGTYKPIFRFVCTHPHQDHICGLAKLFSEHGIRILNFWDIDHSFEPADFEGHPTHEEDWKAYLKLRGSKSPATVLRVTRETTPGNYWNDDEDRIAVLSPSNDLIRYAHFKEDGTEREPSDVAIDEMSYALMIKVNNRKVILAGDGREKPCWDDIYDNCFYEISGCDILKAGHHGQQSSFHEDAVKAMNPSYIVFSNSYKEDKSNGAEKLYSEALPGAQILKTCDSGTIVMHVPFDEDEEISYTESY